MMSGAEGENETGTAEGGEEPLGQGTETQDTQRTDAGAGESVVDGWKDLNPEEFPLLKPEVVTDYNKRMVAQFQNSVRKISESNRTDKEKATKLEALVGRMQQQFGQFMEDPEQFLQFHKQKRPDYWQNRQSSGGQGEMSAEDNQAIAALRKAGFVANEDIAPVIQELQALRNERMAQGTAQAQTEIEGHVKWCTENKYPWNDQILKACTALIGQGDVPSRNLKDAYSLLYQQTIDATTQANLKRKKEGSTLAPAGSQNAKATNLPLRKIIENAYDAGE